MTQTIEQRVQAEVEALHEFFAGWFPGTLPPHALQEDFLPRFSSDLVFIPPAGRLLGLAALRDAVAAGHGSNPAFRVAIRRVQVQREFQGFVLATYEEWQRNAKASEPPDNGRVATVLFENGERLRWLHIHETWLPPEVMAAGPYDF